MNDYKPAQSVADVEQGLVLATVEIDAPPKRVFQALTSADDILKWWGQEGIFRVTGWAADVRPGGKWSSRGTRTDGQPFTLDGEYLEVDPPRKLVFTWRPMGDVPYDTRVTYLLEPFGDGTRLTLRHEGFAGRPKPCREHAGGWLHSLRWVSAYLTPPQQHFLFRLIPPRPSFMYDMTPEERTLMGVHSVYWRGKLAEGKIVAFGPVADPAGAWGVGILRVESAFEAQTLTEHDPVIFSNKGFRYEVLPMPSAVYA